MTVDTSRFRTHLPPAAPQEPPRRRPAVRARRLGLQTTPERIRALAAVAVLAIGGFYIVANIAIGNARDGLRVIGHDAGPQVLATGDLYYALGDMDSQVASILLSGSEPSPGAGQQDVGHLGVHVAEGKVQIAGGQNLRPGVMPDDPQPVPRVSHGDVGDDVEPGHREHRDRGERADTPRRGPQPQPPEARDGPPPGRCLGRRGGPSCSKHVSVSAVAFGYAR